MRRLFFTMLMIAPFLFGSCDTKTKNVDSCGDGFIDPGEQCDGSNLGGASCSTLGYYEVDGVLTCSSQCQLVITECGTARCGDQLLQEHENEQCDGSDLNGQSCQSLGYDRGTLSCTAGCRYDVTDCVGAGSCGDSIIQVPRAVRRQPARRRNLSVPGILCGKLELWRQLPV